MLWIVSEENSGAEEEPHPVHNQVKSKAAAANLQKYPAVIKPPFHIFRLGALSVSGYGSTLSNPLFFYSENGGHNFNEGMKNCSGNNDGNCERSTRTFDKPARASHFEFFVAWSI
jgi:hypothetical protein